MKQKMNERIDEIQMFHFTFIVSQTLLYIYI